MKLKLPGKLMVDTERNILFSQWQLDDVCKEIQRINVSFRFASNRTINDQFTAMILYSLSQPTSETSDGYDGKVQL